MGTESRNLAKGDDAAQMRLAAVLLIGSSIAFALCGAAVKLASATVPNEIVVFFRSVFGVVFVIPFLLRGGLDGLRTPYPRQQVTRALAGLAAMYCFFYGIAHLPLGEAMMLNYSSPLFIPFIARLWLGEPIPPRIASAVGVGFVGIGLVLKPGVGFFSPAAIVGVASGILTAIAMVSIRGLARHEPTTRIVFYFGAVSALAALPAALVAWSTPSLHALGLLVLVGLFATSGQLLLTRAYSLAQAARIGPFTYSTVVFAAVLGWVLWGEVPDRSSVAGSILVGLAGVLAIREIGPRAVEIPEEAIPEAGV